MARLTGNKQLVSSSGQLLFCLRDLNALPENEKKAIYGRLIPERLVRMFAPQAFEQSSQAGGLHLSFIAPEGLGLLRLEIRLHPEDRDTVFFLDIADTPYRQLELAFCVICDPFAPRFDVDIDSRGQYNRFASLGRNISEEIRAMQAGLFPNQTRRGLRLFGEFFPLLEQLADSLGMEMIVAEPLTYDNAVRYEKYGFDYLTGRLLMQRIHEGFAPGGFLHRRLDGSTPFRMPGMERTVRGRSWAIHDGIMDEPWDDVRIYRMIGRPAAINTFPEREEEVSLFLH